MLYFRGRRFAVISECGSSSRPRGPAGHHEGHLRREIATGMWMPRWWCCLPTIPARTSSPKTMVAGVPVIATAVGGLPMLDEASQASWWPRAIPLPSPGRSGSISVPGDGGIAPSAHAASWHQPARAVRLEDPRLLSSPDQEQGIIAWPPTRKHGRHHHGLPGLARPPFALFARPSDRGAAPAAADSYHRSRHQRNASGSGRCALRNMNGFVLRGVRRVVQAKLGAGIR